MNPANTNDAVELLPCPFCGNTNELYHTGIISCDSCGAEGPDREPDYKAAWNRRTLPAPVAQAGNVQGELPLLPKPSYIKGSAGLNHVTWGLGYTENQMKAYAHAALVYAPLAQYNREILVLNDQGVEAAIERRPDGRWEFKLDGFGNRVSLQQAPRSEAVATKWAVYYDDGRKGDDLYDPGFVNDWRMYDSKEDAQKTCDQNGGEYTPRQVYIYAAPAAIEPQPTGSLRIKLEDELAAAVATMDAFATDLDLIYKKYPHISDEMEAMKTGAATECAGGLVEDAARYRWLRNHAKERQIGIWSCHLPEQQDEYADKAIAAMKGKK